MHLLRQRWRGVFVGDDFDVGGRAVLGGLLQGLVQLAAGCNAGGEPAVAAEGVRQFGVAPSRQIVVGDVGILAQEPLDQVTGVIEDEDDGLKPAGAVALVDREWRETDPMTASRATSVFAGFRFPPEVISVAIRWYLRYSLSYRDVEELLAERGITVDHVTVYRRVQRFTQEFIEAARPCRHAPGDRSFVDEAYVKIAGQLTYLYRAVDQHGQVIDVLLSRRRDLAGARRFLTGALRAGTVPVEVTTDRAPVYLRVLDELVHSALHTVEQHANNPIEADHGQLKARLRPMRGLKHRRSVWVLAAGHAFVQNLRRGHYDIATETPGRDRLRVVFHDLALTI